MPVFVQLILSEEEAAFVDAARPSTVARTTYVRGLLQKERERSEKRAADLLPTKKPTKRKKG